MKNSQINSVKITAIVLLSALVLGCSAQDNNAQGDRKPSYVIVTKRKESLEYYSKRFKISIKELKRLNPQIKGNYVSKGDTIFRYRPKVPATPLTETVDTTTKDKPLGKSGLFTSVVFQQKKYFVCRFDPKKFRIEIFNRVNNENKPHTIRSVAALKKEKLVLLVNGGMFKKDLTPEGLFIADKVEYRPVNLETNNGQGNFYDLQPNGIFLLDSNNRPMVMSTEEFVAGNYKPKLATQSGPMLVVQGQFNSNFKKDSQNFNIRNGVGVNKKGEVVLIVSEDPVKFYEFAEFFRDKMECNNALYLDGFVSQYYAPELKNSMEEKFQLAVYLTVSKP